MAKLFVHHRIVTLPREWAAVASRVAADGRRALQAAGGVLYGAWRSQIGRPRDELTVMTVWSDEAGASRSEAILAGSIPEAGISDTELMMPTLRPGESNSPERQGNYAFRWFETPEADWAEFLDLCAAAWPDFEAAYDSQVIGLWRCMRSPEAMVRSLLLTRRPDLSMWERSKLPQGETEVEVRRKLSRRYDLCDWTVVYTTTLLTAADRQDTARWT